MMLNCGRYGEHKCIDMDTPNTGFRLTTALCFALLSLGLYAYASQVCQQQPYEDLVHTSQVSFRVQHFLV